MLCLLRPWTQVVSPSTRQVMWRRLYKKQTSKTGYISLQGEILYGVHPVSMALAAMRRTVHCLYYNKASEKAEQVVKLCKEKGIPFRHLDTQALTDLCRQADKYKERHVHQGVVLDVSKLYHYPMDYLMPQVVQPPPPPPPSSTSPPVWVLLCSVKDPYNLGSIVRTSYFLGVSRVVVTGVRCDLSCTVSKASAGTLELLPVYSVRNPVKLLGDMVSQDWRVLATCMPGQDNDSMSEDRGDMSEDRADMSEDRSDVPEDRADKLETCSVRKLSLSCPTVLVLGSEGGGIPPDLMSCVTQGVFVPPGRPLDTHVDSLNVSVAAAIVLHKLCSGNMI